MAIPDPALFKSGADSRLESAPPLELAQNCFSEDKIKGQFWPHLPLFPPQLGLNNEKLIIITF